MNKKNKKSPLLLKGRYYVVAVGTLALFLALFVRVAYIQVINSERLVYEGDIRSIRTQTSYAERGIITDRMGVELAVSVPVKAVWADAKDIERFESLANTSAWEALARVLNMDLDKLLARVSDPSRRFVYIQRQVSPEIADYIQKLKIRGVYLKPESRRFYPSGEVSAHLVGLTNIDGNGLEGIERSYNDYLIGEPGARRLRKDLNGRVIDELAIISEGKEAQSIQLSIDQRIQAIAYSELKTAVVNTQATSGSVVAIDIATGEILAMANSPSFNPNSRSELQHYRLRNRAVTDSYEPGSTVKPFTILAALEKELVQEDSIIDTSPGWMQIGGRRVRDGRNHGKMDLSEVVKRSSNVGTSQLALKVGVEDMLGVFQQVGFGNYSGLALSGESAGVLPQRHRWSDFELATLSFGYGLTVTPLQLAQAYATLGAGGVYRPLSLLKLNEPLDGQQVFSATKSQAVIEMMESVVAPDGTGRRAAVSGYRVAGKTGTTRKAVRGGYGDDYIAIFAGLAPASNPKIALVVVVNEPKTDNYYGGEVAAPVFSKVMQASLQFYNVAPDNQPQQTVKINKGAKNES